MGLVRAITLAASWRTAEGNREASSRTVHHARSAVRPRRQRLRCNGRQHQCYARQATDAAATQQTVSASGYAPSRVSTASKRQVFAAYHIKKKQQRRYVINHLVPVSLGGTNDTSNLWPQLRGEAKKKAAQETSVQTLVCTNLVDLAAAQQAFQSNWQTAGQTAQTAADTRKAAIAQYVEAQKQAEQAAAAKAAADAAAAQAAAAQAAADAAAAQAQQQAQQQQQQQQSCPNGTYVNTAGNTVCSPYSSPSGPPAGATAQCRDGTYSFSQSRSGTCSSHGGVAQWL